MPEEVRYDDLLAQSRDDAARWSDREEPERPVDVADLADVGPVLEDALDTLAAASYSRETILGFGRVLASPETGISRAVATTDEIATILSSELSADEKILDCRPHVEWVRGFGRLYQHGLGASNEARGRMAEQITGVGERVGMVPAILRAHIAGQAEALELHAYGLEGELERATSSLRDEQGEPLRGLPASDALFEAADLVGRAIDRLTTDQDTANALEIARYRLEKLRELLDVVVTQRYAVDNFYERAGSQLDTVATDVRQLQAGVVAATLQ